MFFQPWTSTSQIGLKVKHRVMDAANGRIGPWATWAQLLSVLLARTKSGWARDCCRDDARVTVLYMFLCLFSCSTHLLVDFGHLSQPTNRNQPCLLPCKRMPERHAFPRFMQSFLPCQSMVRGPPGRFGPCRWG